MVESLSLRMEASIVYRTDRPVSQADLSKAAAVMKIDLGGEGGAAVSERVDEVSIIAAAGDARGELIGHACVQVFVHVPTPAK